MTTYKEFENCLTNNIIEQCGESFKEKITTLDLFIRQSYDQPTEYVEPTEEQFQEYISLLRLLVEKYPKMILVLAAAMFWMNSPFDISHVFQFIPACKSERVLIQSVVSTMFGNLWNEDMETGNALYYDNKHYLSFFNKRAYLLDHLDIPYDVDFMENLTQADKCYNSRLHNKKLDVSYIVTRLENEMIHFCDDKGFVCINTCLTDHGSDHDEGTRFAMTCTQNNYHHMLTYSVRQQLCDILQKQYRENRKCIIKLEGLSDEFKSYFNNTYMNSPSMRNQKAETFIYRFLGIIRTIEEVWNMPVDMTVIETVFRNYLENCYCCYNKDAVWAYDKFKEDIMINYNHFSVDGNTQYPAEEVYGEITTYARPSNTVQRWKSHKVTVRVEDAREFLIHEDCGNTEGFACTDEDINKFVNEVLKPMTEPEDLQDSCMIHDAVVGDNIQKCITFYLYDEDVTMPREYME